MKALKFAKVQKDASITFPHPEPYTPVSLVSQVSRYPGIQVFRYPGIKVDRAVIRPIRSYKVSVYFGINTSWKPAKTL